MEYEWTVELITDEVMCNTISISAKNITKHRPHVLFVDGVKWEVPCELMCFGRVEKDSY